MQIIGESKDGYILSATKDELANLVGCYSQYSDGLNTMNLKTGQEIKISIMYRQLYNLSSKERELGEVRKTLLKMVETLETINPIIPDIEIPKNT